MANSIRENAVQEIVTLFEGQKKGVPTADPYPFAWSEVIRGPLATEKERRKNRAMGVVEGPENSLHGIQFIRCVLDLTLEWSIRLEPDDEPAELANEVLTSIQRKIGESITLGDQLGVEKFWEVGNVFTVEDYTDRIIEGATFVKLQYKRAQHDPRVTHGQAGA